MLNTCTCSIKLIYIFMSIVLNLFVVNNGAYGFQSGLPVNSSLTSWSKLLRAADMLCWTYSV